MEALARSSNTSRKGEIPESIIWRNLFNLGMNVSYPGDMTIDMILLLMMTGSWFAFSAKRHTLL
jgi:hypothetical protein